MMAFLGRHDVMLQLVIMFVVALFFLFYDQWVRQLHKELVKQQTQMITLHCRICNLEARAKVFHQDNDVFAKRAG